MAVITCKNCGNDIVVGPGVTLAICKQCGCRHVIVGQEGTNGPTTETLLKRGQLFLEDKNWTQASNYFDMVLNIDPEYCEAYLGMFCVDMHYRTPADMANGVYTLDEIEENANFRKAIRFANDEQKAEIENYILSAKQAQAERQKAALSAEERTHARMLSQREYLSKAKVADLIACCAYFDVALKEDGTVLCAFDDDHNRKKYESKLSSWHDIVAVSAGDFHVVGLKADGTVVAVGYNKEKQCNVSHWTGIVAVAAGFQHTVGLKADGTVVATGLSKDDLREIYSWRDIVAVAAGFCFAVGLKADGTVVATGLNRDGQCNVSSWTNIVAIAAHHEHTVGLKADGTVVAVGRNDRQQCEVSSLRNIVTVATGGDSTYALNADGDMIRVELPAPRYGILYKPSDRFSVMSSDTIAVASTVQGADRDYHFLCLHKDGTVTMRNQYPNYPKLFTSLDSLIAARERQFQQQRAQQRTETPPQSEPFSLKSLFSGWRK